LNTIPVGNFTGTGMHGGKIYICTEKKPENLPVQVIAEIANKEELKEIEPYITEFAKNFEIDSKSLLEKKFLCLKPNGKNPYKQLYTAN